MRRLISICTLLVLLDILCTPLPLVSAPAPLIKKPGRKGEFPEGKWKGNLGNVVVIFHSDGTYHESWYGIKFSGAWNRKIGGIYVTCRQVVQNNWEVAVEFKMKFNRQNT